MHPKQVQTKWALLYFTPGYIGTTVESKLPKSDYYKEQRNLYYCSETGVCGAQCRWGVEGVPRLLGALFGEGCVFIQVCAGKEESQPKCIIAEWVGEHIHLPNQVGFQVQASPLLAYLRDGRVD